MMWIFLTSDTNGMHGLLSMPFLSKHNIIDPTLFVE
jgi:hypothetical protein